MLLDVAFGSASQDTIKTYSRQVQFYYQWCRESKLDVFNCQKKDLKRYRAHLIEQRFKPRTISLKLSVARAFYRALIDLEERVDNPVSDVFAPQPRTRHYDRTNFLELQELQELIEAIPKRGLQARRDRLQQVQGGIKDVSTAFGTVDLLTGREVIAIEQIDSWQAGLLRLQKVESMFPGHSLRLHLYEVSAEDSDRLIAIKAAIAAAKINVTSEAS